MVLATRNVEIASQIGLKKQKKVTEEELTQIRFQLILKMLETDPKLRKLVKGFALTYL